MTMRIQKKFDTLTEQVIVDNNNNQYVLINTFQMNNLLSKT